MLLLCKLATSQPCVVRGELMKHDRRWANKLKLARGFRVQDWFRA